MNANSILYEACTTRELINIVLTNNDEDDADSVYWKAMSTLHLRGTAEVFEAARSLCLSLCSHEQRIGCNILAQLGCPEQPFATESFPLVAAVVRGTDNLDTLGCALCAIGWLRDLRGMDTILPYLDHPDSDIRYWVTHGLVALHEDQRSIAGLIHLTTDSCVEVRDWATFGLGSMTEQDTPEIRQALMARLDDLDDIVRGEALVGLAKRQDERVVEPLRQALEAGIYGKEISDYAREALDALNDFGKYPQLLKWKSHE
jgi:HEAT repeat protein